MSPNILMAGGYVLGLAIGTALTTKDWPAFTAGAFHVFFFSIVVTLAQ